MRKKSQGPSRHIVNMFSGIKIIPRNEVRDNSSDDEKDKSKSRKDRRKKDVDRKAGRREGSKRDGKKIFKDGDDEIVDELHEGDIVRKNIGLDWMLPPTQKADPNPDSDVEEKLEVNLKR